MLSQDLKHFQPLVVILGAQTSSPLAFAPQSPSFLSGNTITASPARPPQADLWLTQSCTWVPSIA